MLSLGLGVGSGSVLDKISSLYHRTSYSSDKDFVTELPIAVLIDCFRYNTNVCRHKHMIYTAKH